MTACIDKYSTIKTIILEGRDQDHNGHDVAQTFVPPRDKSNKTAWHVRPANTQSSLGIRPV